jgi:ribosomal protein L37AE/L43A
VDVLHDLSEEDNLISTKEFWRCPLVKCKWNNKGICYNPYFSHTFECAVFSTLREKEKSEISEI